MGLTFAILETALVFFAGQTLETAVTDSARLIMTGQAQDKAWTKDDFKTEVCSRIHGLFDCTGGVYVDVKTFDSFASINNDLPVTDGKIDESKLNFSPGAPGQIEVVTLYYQWPVYVSLLGNNLANINANRRLLVATAVFSTNRSQPRPLQTPAIRRPAMKAVTLRLITLLRSFKRDRDGASAIEFAILAPLLITLYLGCVEITDGIAADRKVTLTAGALANLTSQSQTITVDGMTNILNASAAVIKPYSVGNLAATITCLKIDADGVAKVKWSATLNGTARADGSTVTFPSADLAVPNSYLVWSEVNYNYTPVVGYTISGTLPLSDQMFMSRASRRRSTTARPAPEASFVTKSGQDPASGVA